MDNKLHVEFIGMWGSGKSTIYQALKDDLLSVNSYDNVIFGHEKAFHSYGNLYRHIVPIFLNLYKTLSLALFFITLKASPYVERAGPSFIRRKKMDLFKHALANALILRKNGCDYMIQDDGIFHVVASLFELKDKDIFRLLSLYPKKSKICFVYVDTPVQEGFERFKNRARETEFEVYYKKNGESFNLELYKRINDKLSTLFSFLSSENESCDAIDKAIRIDGTQPIEVNISLIKKSLGINKH